MQIKKQGWRIEEFIVKIKLHFLVINLVFFKKYWIVIKKKIKFLKNFFTNKILYNRIQLAVFLEF